MFSRLVEEYHLNVARHHIPAYDALIEHRIPRFDEAKGWFEEFDRFVHTEVERFWTAQLRKFGSCERREFNEWIEENLADPYFLNHFWEAPVIARLTEPQKVRLYLDFQFAVIDRFEGDLDSFPRNYVVDLLQLYGRAYGFVHPQVARRLSGRGYDSD
jgi:hypothetical protein